MDFKTVEKRMRKKMDEVAKSKLSDMVDDFMGKEDVQKEIETAEVGAE